MGNNAQRSATVTKLLRGTARADRRRDDGAVKPAGVPELPPGARLSARERALWDWYTANIPPILGAVDGGVLLRLTKVTARVEEIEAAVEAAGMILVAPSGRVTVHPLFTAQMAATSQYRALLRDAGLSPAARLNLAPTEGKAEGWGDVD
jgi:P27 family predicted phage terminase small subunit